MGATVDATGSYAPVLILIGALMPLALIVALATMGRVVPVDTDYHA
ncbi:MAG TPA: hypothetical protein VFY29_11240 [Terriglobia bacterium]|nr:hypothetical protein [Terriglobia bacterium]